MPTGVPGIRDALADTRFHRVPVIELAGVAAQRLQANIQGC